MFSSSILVIAIYQENLLFLKGYENFSVLSHYVSFPPVMIRYLNIHLVPHKLNRMFLT